MSGALGSVLFAHFDVAIVPSCAYRSAFPCGGVLPSRATQGLLDNTCWSGLVAGIVEGGVGGAGARATDGVGRGVCFRRPLGCLRGRAADGGRPHQEDSI